jgi:hypothetical protein
MNVGFRVGYLLNLFTAPRSSVMYLNDASPCLNDDELSAALFANDLSNVPNCIKNDKVIKPLIHPAVMSVVGYRSVSGR